MSVLLPAPKSGTVIYQLDKTYVEVLQRAVNESSELWVEVKWGYMEPIIGWVYGELTEPPSHWPGATTAPGAP